MSAVSNYMVRARGLVEELVFDSFSVTRSEALADVFVAVVKGRLPRKGRLASGTEYAVHGAGCFFSTGAGELLDVDVNGPVDMLLFDVRRVLDHAKSIGSDLFTADQIMAAANAVAEGGGVERIEKVSGHVWFGFRWS